MINGYGAYYGGHREFGHGFGHGMGGASIMVSPTSAVAVSAMTWAAASGMAEGAGTAK